LLQHERRYWRATAATAGLDVDEELQRRVVALATLAGAADEDEAAGLLALIDDLSDASSKERRHRLARWAHSLYPSQDTGYWGPLEPDLVGEQLVATTLGDRPAVLDAVLDRATPAAAARPLVLYARAAPDHPTLRDTLSPILAARLRGLCKLAIAQAAAETDRDLMLSDRTLAATLQLAVTTITVDPAGLADVADALPPRPDLVLGPLALTLTSQVADHHRDLASTDAAAHEPSLARWLNNLSERLAHAGRRDEGLAAIEEAVSVRRRLAGANAAAYEPDLAQSLNNLSNRLGEAGRPGEGLAAIEEAVSVYRRLAGANAAAYEPDLAQSLNNLSIRLGEAGRPGEGLAAIEEAVSVYRRLAGANAAAYEPALASSLNNLSIRLGEAGRPGEGLAAIEEAVSVRRRLAGANAAAYEPDLAQSLNNLSNWLGEAGRRDEAERVRAEAARLRAKHAR
jgi:hypothetical protein